MFILLALNMKSPAGSKMGNYKLVSGQLQNNPVNGAMLIAVNRVIITVMSI